MSKAQILFSTLLVTAALIFTTGCRKAPSVAIEVGGIYSVSDANNGYSIVKLLVHEDKICHFCLYKQKFPTRPTTVDVNTLTIGKPGDPDGFGIAHLPMPEATFFESQPVLITKTEVTPQELEGHRIWKASGGGILMDRSTMKQ